MSVIAALKTYLLTYSELKAGAEFGVDFLGPGDMGYSIVPQPGDRVLEEYINGGSLRVFPFAFQSVESTADDPARVGANEFFEEFAEWLEDQTDDENLPTLDEGKVAVTIEATSHVFILQQGESGVGVYQMQCRLVYQQEP
jgi:hypothetical protein